MPAKDRSEPAVPLAIALAGVWGLGQPDLVLLDTACLHAAHPRCILLPCAASFRFAYGP
ncbi:hypothetical protein THIARS_60081 [Thiomonas delicata]|uniref:Uncharacterized protein n=1 Tax=Thiomonas delicata TaxID=364030 RepID=A0A238D258_THIDL|nr:hypothetical protein THIARS_60081 [Thiomonas delicata]